MKNVTQGCFIGPLAGTDKGSVLDIDKDKGSDKGSVLDIDM
jgi:hypothetical protein